MTKISPARLLGILLSYVKPYARRGVLLVLTLLIEGAFVTLLALSLKFLIDFAITPREATALLLIIAGLCLGFLLTAISQVVRDYLYAWLGAHILNDIRKEMFRHFQRLSLGFYARSRMGDLLRRATRFNFLSYVTERSPNIGMLLFNVLLISGGSYLAYRGSLSIGSLVSFNALFITVSSSVMGLTTRLELSFRRAFSLTRACCR